MKLDESDKKDSVVNLFIQKPFIIDQVLSLVQEGMALRERFKEV